MDTRRLLLGAAVVLVLISCGKASRQEALTTEQEVAQAKSQIVASPALQIRGTTLSVPSRKYPTIAAALAAARSGDLVRVAPGTYRECPILVNGVILQGLPGATLDGAGCDPTILGVVSGDATIVHGATVQGFTILPSAIAGVYLNGTRGVHVLDIKIAGTSRPIPRTIWMEASTGAYVGGCRLDSPGGVALLLGSTAVLWDLTSPLVRSSQSSFVLEHSLILGSPGRDGVNLTQGSQAVLVGNDITGGANGVNVLNGNSGVDPLWAPSKAWLMNNTIHDSGSGGNQGSGINGLNVGNTGSEVRGVGNRYSGNGRGLSVTGGGSYLGFQDSFTDSLSVGVFAYGVSVRNSTAFSEEAVIKLDKATVRGNLQGGMSACGSTMELRNSTVTGNQGSGAQLNSHCYWGGLDQGSTPSSLSAHGTVFAGSGDWGVSAYEDSQLLLGSLSDPGGNAFLGNLTGSIANFSTNHVDAQWNWFGTTDSAAIASSIAGDVTYEPFLAHAPSGWKCAEVPAGMVSWWPGYGARDIVGRNDGVLREGARLVKGLVGEAFQFNGAGAYVEAPDHGMPYGNAPRSLELWMKPEFNARFPFIYGEPVVDNAFYPIVMDANICIGQWGGGDLCGATNVVDGSWHHIALTYDGESTATLYVDGRVQVAWPGKSYYTTPAGGHVYLGSNFVYSGDPESFAGLVDEVSFYGRALRQQEVLDIYVAGSAGKCGGKDSPDSCE